MLKDILGKCIILCLALLCAGCDDVTQQQAGYDFPNVLPIWIVERDPNITIYERKDLRRDRNVGKILVVPLYMDYHDGSTTDDLAIAHPFVYRPGNDIEAQLTSLGQRENLRRLIVWAPGYFPGSIGRTFPWIPVINGKRMIVLELQPCISLEEDQINAAMKELLLDGDFVIEEQTQWKHHPPYSNTPIRVEEPYDFTQLVRSQGIAGRFFQYGTTLDFALWGFGPGTKIVNHLSDEEKKTVATFVAEAARRDKGNEASGVTGDTGERKTVQ